LSNYTKSTNFATKDNLSPGDPLKIVRGTEIDTEFNNISTAISTKTDNSAAAITGGSISGITDLAIADGGTGASTATAALNNLLPSQTSAANKYLQSDGTNASWDAVTLSTADITGTLPVANGGTGITSLGTGIATFLGTPSSANLIAAVTDETGTGALVFANTPTLVAPNLGTPNSLVGTNITGTATSFTASNVTTNANLTGDVTSVGNATTLTNAPVIAKVLTGYVSGAGTVAATDSILQAIQKLNGNDATNANLTGMVTSVGNATTVVTNANLTGAVTSSGNATSLGSFTSAQLLGALTDETGTGANVFANTPTLIAPLLGTPTSGNFSTGTFTWPTFNQNTTGTAAGLSATLATTSGGTGLTSFTSGGVVYASSSSALATGSALTFDGSSLGVSGNLTVDSGTLFVDATNNRVGIGTTSPNYNLLVENTAGDCIIGSTGGTASYAQIVFGDSDNKAIGRVRYNNNGDSLEFFVNGAERARFDSSGNLGIGTSSPSTKLHVVGVGQVSGNFFAGFGGTTANIISSSSVTTGGAGFSEFLFGNASTNNRGYLTYGHATDSLLIGTAGGTRATLDSSGNLGLGVTPSAWYTPTSTALQVRQASFYAVENSALEIGNNAFLTSGGSTWNYINTGFATRYNSSSGKHIWFNAPSGTAGNPISFTQAMTLDASGNLGVGTTSPAKRLHVAYNTSSDYTTFRISNSGSTANIDMGVGGSGVGGALANNAYIYNTGNSALVFGTNDTERARIDSSGNLLVGTTSVQSGSPSDPVGISLYGPSATGTGIFVRNGIPLYVNNKNASGNLIEFYCNGNSVGNISSTGTITIYNTTSDYRLKTVVGEVTGHGDRLDALEPIEYTWTSNGTRSRGFLAHKFQEVYPQSVTGEKDAIDEQGNPKYQSMQAATSEVIADLVAEIQSLRQRLSAANL
jgi:hypothetical protein